MAIVAEADIGGVPRVGRPRWELERPDRRPRGGEPEDQLLETEVSRVGRSLERVTPGIDQETPPEAEIGPLPHVERQRPAETPLDTADRGLVHSHQRCELTLRQAATQP